MLTMTNSTQTTSFTITWEDDWSVVHVHEYPDAYDTEPDTCEGCVIRGANGDVLASLWCVDDADDAYRAAIEAELTEEAQHYLSTIYVDTYRRMAAKVAA